MALNSSNKSLSVPKPREDLTTSDDSFQPRNTMTRREKAKSEKIERADQVYGNYQFYNLLNRHAVLLMLFNRKRAYL